MAPHLHEEPRGLVLTTHRLRLSLPSPDDARRLRAFFVANDEHFHPWGMAVRPGAGALDDWVDVIRDWQHLAHEGRALHFFATRIHQPGGAYVGLVQLSRIEQGQRSTAILGYGLDHRHQGHGLMLEAVRAAIVLAFEELRLHRLEVSYMPSNRRSAALLERLGFTTIGVAPSYLWAADGWRDHVLAQLVNPVAPPPGR